MNRVVILLVITILTAAAASCNSDRSHPSTDIASTAASPSPVVAIRHVDDTANVIDGSSRQALETTLAALEERKNIDFYVVIVGNTGGLSARDYSLLLARERKSRRNDETLVAGLLLVVAVNDRKWHIQITRNLEDDLTNEILTKLSVPMTDAFQQKRFAEGVTNYVNAIIGKLEEIELTNAGDS